MARRAPGRSGSRQQVRRAVERAEQVRIALVGATIDEARRVMVEGPSGLLNVARDLVAEWHPSRRLLRLAGGSEAHALFGRESRGPARARA